MKKLLLVIIFTISALNCFSVTVFLKDNNQLTGKIVKIDNKNIYISPHAKTLFIVNKPDIRSIMGGDIDITVDVLTRKSHGRVNYNSYLKVISIELDRTENAGNIDYTADLKSEYELSNISSTINELHKGFIIGIGIGGHSTNSKMKRLHDDDTYDDPESKMGFATDFRIGYSLQNNIEVYYISKVAWFTIKNRFDNSDVIGYGIGAAGFTYFFSEKLNSAEWKPSPYISLGVGYTSLNVLLKIGSFSVTGSGFFASVGYEFNQHQRVEFSYLIDNPSNKEDLDDLITNSKSLMLSLNYVWY